MLLFASEYSATYRRRSLPAFLKRKSIVWICCRASVVDASSGVSEWRGEEGSMERESLGACSS